ncbi:hypothetical protein BJA01nite_82640 [Bradyrhizobium japonicum]|nr:hypothetical protein BJA01nite_82640 [Bradyrhizobium japonicum]
MGRLRLPCAHSVRDKWTDKSNNKRDESATADDGVVKNGCKALINPPRSDAATKCPATKPRDGWHTGSENALLLVVARLRRVPAGK